MTRHRRVLLADDEAVLRGELAAFLEEEGWRVDEACDVAEANSRIRATDFDIIISDLQVPGGGGLAVLKEARRWSPSAGVIFISASPSVRSAVGALSGGGDGYLVKPVMFQDVLTQMNRLVEHRSLTAENRYLRQYLEGCLDRFGELVGDSAPMRAVFEGIRRVAPLDSTVLIQGESGTGKELVSRLVHKSGPRSEGPFIPVHGRAVPSGLLESRLFGHARDAFTGTGSNQDGLVRAARGGTLFLDEISTLDLDLLAKLMRVFEEGKATPVGSTRPFDVDVRLVVATDQDLHALALEWRSREDLHDLLDVDPIKLPPLRERVEDIPLLISQFVQRFNTELGLGSLGDQRDGLTRHPWEGSVRELANVIQRAMTLCDADLLTTPPWHGADSSLEDRSLAAALGEFERGYIERAIARHRSRQETASALGISRTTLWRRIRELGLEKKFGGLE